MEVTQTGGEYVQFGCGLCAPPTWRNFDAGPAFWLQKHVPVMKPLLLRRGFPDYPANIAYGDVVKGLPVAPGSAAAVYCSHVLEHLALADLRTTLRNTFGYLQPGGTFRFVLPDLEWLAWSYVNSEHRDAASRFMRDSYLGTEDAPGGSAGWMRMIFGRSAHLWMWDYKNLSEELEHVGFTEVRRAEIFDNPDPRFREVEDPGRWENCLGMECRRPG